MKRQVQQSFLGQQFKKPADCFGGSLHKGNPKTKRPLESKMPIHLVLRSERSALRLPKTFKIVDDMIAATAKKHGITIYKCANVGNHLHLLLKIRNVSGWAAFIRELTGRLAQIVMERVKWPKGLKFWKFRPYTRIVRGWQKAFQSVKMYVHLNGLESEGFISRRETKSLRDLRMIWADG